MFNSSGTAGKFYNNKVLGGFFNGDVNSHRTLYAGPDPAEPNRVLIRKLLQISDRTYAYEETRITRVEGKSPTVHSTIYRIRGFDLDEKLDPQEITIRGAFRPMPNVLGFSLYYRQMKSGARHFSVVENALFKTGGTWFEWFSDLKDRRDMSIYLRSRWSRM